MVRVEIMDGIPCIILEEGIICLEKDLKSESRKLIMPEYFTIFQHSKEQSYFNEVLKELKEKFGEE